MEGLKPPNPFLSQGKEGQFLNNIIKNLIMNTSQLNPDFLAEVNPKHWEVFQDATKENLTYANCIDKGYEFTGEDVYFDYGIDTPTEAVQQALEAIQAGYKLGEPTNPNTQDNGFYGLYKKLK